MRKLKRMWRRVKLEFRYHKNYLTSKPMSKYYKRHFRKRKMKHVISMLTRRCDGKGHICNGGWAYVDRNNSAYVNDMSNYSYCCKDCHEHIDEMFQEMWDEYNAGRY